MSHASQRLNRFMKFFWMWLGIQFHTWWNEPNRCLTWFRSTRKNIEFSAYLYIFAVFIDLFHRFGLSKSCGLHWKTVSLSRKRGRDWDRERGRCSDVVLVRRDWNWNTNRWVTRSRERTGAGLDLISQKRAITIRGFEVLTIPISKWEHKILMIVRKFSHKMFGWCH